MPNERAAEKLRAEQAKALAESRGDGFDQVRMDRAVAERRRKRAKRAVGYVQGWTRYHPHGGGDWMAIRALVGSFGQASTVA